jgi:hypothetical protein
MNWIIYVWIVHFAPIEKRVTVHINDGCYVIPSNMLSAHSVNHIVVNPLFVSSHGFKRVLSQAVGQSQSSRHAVCIKARRISQSDVKSSPPQMKPSPINSIGACKTMETPKNYKSAYGAPYLRIWQDGGDIRAEGVSFRGLLFSIQTSPMPFF